MSVEKHVESSTAENIFSGIFSVGLIALIVGSYAVNWLGIGVPQLEVVASAIEMKQATGGPSDKWVVRGKVLYRGQGVPGASVWAIARDSHGNRYAPKTSVTDQLGSFELEPFPKVIGSVKEKEVTEVSVFATGTATKQGEKDAQAEKELLKGEELLGLSDTGRTRWIQFPPAALVAIPTIFFVSLMLGLFRISPGSSWIKAQYFGSAALGIVFTLTMVGYISLGLYRVSVSGSPGDALSLGFATIFHGTYVGTVGPEWLFSLTAPGTITLEPVSGFGAPLWVLLLSVLGSGVYTVSLVVGHIAEDIKFDDPVEVRKLVQTIVKHQFYVLFSPLGAVIVYQLLVIGGAASQAVTVALTAIAAGVALNAILDKAVKAVTQLLSK
jgi:hypothetical protein